MVSEPSEPIAISVYPDHQNIAIDNFSVTALNENAGNQIDIEFDISEVDQIWIYKKESDQRPRILRKIEPPETQYIDRRVDARRQTEYFIQVIFSDGVKSLYSNSKIAE